MDARQLARIALLSLLFQPTSVPAKERVLISTLRGWYTTALEELAEQYEQMHPGIDVKINLQPDMNSLSRYYTAQMAVDRADAPDVVHGNLLGVEENYHGKRFLAINEYLERPNPYAGSVVWRDLFDPALLASLAVDGIQHCVLPLDFCDTGVFYNLDIFNRYGLAPPDTWDEWLDLSRVLEDKGFIPIAIPATVQDDFTSMFNNMFEDACMRNFIPLLMAQPGDWNYVEANSEYVHDLNDRHADRFITINPERMARGFLDGTISYELPMFVEAYSQYRRITPYLGFGFLGTDQTGAYNLFLTGRAAMWQAGSWRVGSLIRDLREMPGDRSFDWAVFPFPSLSSSQHSIAPLRGLGGAGHQFCVVDKNNPAQHDRVVDFLMFLFSPDQTAYLIRRTLEVGEFIQGVPMVKGAEEQLPEEVLTKLQGFGGRGYAKAGLFHTDEEYRARVRPWTQLFSLGRLTPEEFLREKQALTMELMHRMVKRRGYDLDPTTEDTPPW